MYRLALGERISPAKIKYAKENEKREKLFAFKALDTFSLKVHDYFERE